MEKLGPVLSSSRCCSLKHRLTLVQADHQSKLSREGCSSEKESRVFKQTNQGIKAFISTRKSSLDFELRIISEFSPAKILDHETGRT